MFVTDIKDTEYNPYYKPYVNKTEADVNLADSLKNNLEASLEFLETIDETTFNYSYAEGKWTVKEVLQHIIDTERVFSYRAMRFARHDKENLLGFDQDTFAAVSHANSRSKQDLINEFKANRQATIALFSGFTNEMLQQIGTASSSDMSVRAVGFIIAGHTAHHIGVVKERYL